MGKVLGLILISEDDGRGASFKGLMFCLIPKACVWCIGETGFGFVPGNCPGFVAGAPFLGCVDGPFPLGETPTEGDFLMTGGFLAGFFALFPVLPFGREPAAPNRLGLTFVPPAKCTLLVAEEFPALPVETWELDAEWLDMVADCSV